MSKSIWTRRPDWVINRKPQQNRRCEHVEVIDESAFGYWGSEDGFDWGSPITEFPCKGAATHRGWLHDPWTGDTVRVHTCKEHAADGPSLRMYRFRKDAA